MNSKTLLSVRTACTPELPSFALSVIIYGLLEPRVFKTPSSSVPCTSYFNFVV
ncbi:hypothetical protein WN48_00006 [Eufriesea mexicana]|uniref:Uncharacterized protein n=1 Tax=Eufriesea mexicana TaxID=516756 RepID=A0A310S3Q0_9HYME|nr:hypothetical protein WN48_00006 [Eufriesea mexicana]